ncbi:MAG: SulP family inorganic anion transporter [Casimicrobiaceae bacterium]
MPDPSQANAKPTLLARCWPWTAGYDRSLARYDAIAGTTLAAYAVPSSIAYAQLAGMPVATGLYCYLFAGIAYALFGTSRQLAVGPTSSIALTLATTLGALALGDPARYTGMAAATALLAGLIALGAAAMRWGVIVHFISETVLTGFKIGAGIVIAVSQLPMLLGIPSSGHSLDATLADLFAKAGSTHVPSLIVGAVAYVLLVLGQWRWSRWPVPLIVVLLAIGIGYMSPFTRLSIATVGAIPAGLPALTLPDLFLEDLDKLLPLAFACFLIAYNEAMASARLMAARHDYRVDPNRELVAQGAANVAIAFGHGFPSGGGLSQSLVNDAGGARTPVAAVVCSAWMAVVLVYLTGLFVHLPQPLLAALVLASVNGMFRFDELRQLRRVSMPEFTIAMLTIIAVLGLGILKGVLVAATFSLAMLIRRLAQPECAVLGRFPGTRTYAAIARHPRAQPVAGVLIVRPNAALLYFNAETVREEIQAELDRATEQVRLVVLDLSFSTDIDLSTVRMLAELARRLQARGIPLRIGEAHYHIRKQLIAEHLDPLLGDLSRLYSVADLVDAQAGASVPSTA